MRLLLTFGKPRRNEVLVQHGSYQLREQSETAIFPIPFYSPEAIMTNFNEDELKRNVKDKDTWLKFVYLVIFGIAFYLSVLIAFPISIFQFLAKLFSGSAFAGLSDFGENIATYQSQVTRYMTFASDEKPFPFAPFPAKTPPSV
jgi:Domain of unknown function (DUF4389)